VWNVQESLDEALRLARRQLGFRLYYIRDVAPSIGLSEAEALELEAKQPEMIRALFQGAEPWMPPAHVADWMAAWSASWSSSGWDSARSRWPRTGTQPPRSS